MVRKLSDCIKLNRFALPTKKIEDENDRKVL